MITKKYDWSKDKYAIGFKIFTPEGSTIEMECPHMSKEEGERAASFILNAVGIPSHMWSDKQPTKPGYYWFYGTLGSMGEISDKEPHYHICRVHKDGALFFGHQPAADKLPRTGKFHPAALPPFKDGMRTEDLG